MKKTLFAALLLGSMCTLAAPHVQGQQTVAYLSDMTTSLKMQGNYSSTTAYNKNDVVLSGGILYYALQGSTNQAPANGSAYWSVLTAPQVSSLPSGNGLVKVTNGAGGLATTGVDYSTPSGVTSQINAGLAAAGINTNASTNGYVNQSYTGTAPATPAANTVQQQQAVAVSTPYTYSMPGTPPPDSAHSFLQFLAQTINGAVVYVGQWVSAATGSVAGTIPGEWFFNEGTGTSSVNQGTGPVMTITNGTWTSQSGLSGGALAFNGSTNTSTETLATAPGGSFSLATGQAMGVCSYFSPSATSLYSRVIGTESSTGSSSGVSGWEFGLQNGAFFYEVAGTGGYNGNDSVSTTGGSYSANTLVFACANYNGSGSVTFYVNGVPQSTAVAKNSLTTSPASTGVLTVGKLRGDTTTAAGNSVYSGNLGPLFIVIGRQFTTSEINSMYGNPYAKI